MSKHMYSTANLTDVELKDQGNRMFSSRKYDDAINLYTKAIVSDCTFTLSAQQPFPPSPLWIVVVVLGAGQL